MHATHGILVALACVALAGCDSGAGAAKRYAAGGASCPDDQVKVRNVSGSYKLRDGFRVYEVTVCGGSPRIVCNDPSGVVRDGDCSEN